MLEAIVYTAFAAFGAYVIFVAITIYQGHKRQRRMADQVRKERGR